MHVPAMAPWSPPSFLARRSQATASRVAFFSRRNVQHDSFHSRREGPSTSTSGGTCFLSRGSQEIKAEIKAETKAENNIIDIITICNLSGRGRAPPQRLNTTPVPFYVASKAWNENCLIPS